MAIRIKSLSSATAIAMIFAQVPAYAEPTMMLGLALNFGGGESKVGATAKILSNNKPKEFVGVAGITYFFNDGSFGVDAGIGYSSNKGAVTLTYDFLAESPQFSAGLAAMAPIVSVC